MAQTGSVGQPCPVQLEQGSLSVGRVPPSVCPKAGNNDSAEFWISNFGLHQVKDGSVGVDWFFIFTLSWSFIWPLTPSSPPRSSATGQRGCVLVIKEPNMDWWPGFTDGWMINQVINWEETEVFWILVIDCTLQWITGSTGLSLWSKMKDIIHPDINVQFWSIILLLVVCSFTGWCYGHTH